MGEANRRNVIVVGAGASQEFGLPTGFQLTEKLQRHLGFKVDKFGNLKNQSGDPALARAIHSYSMKYKCKSDELFRIATKICNNMSLAPSIDNFLDTHRSNEQLVKIGKIAIANAIIQAERSSNLRIDESNIYNRLSFGNTQETWAAVFFKLIAAKRDFKSFLHALQNITFISFNYDRCIKQFFTNAAASYFDLEAAEIIEVLKAVDVIHPYGSLGELIVAGQRTGDFGMESHPDTILASSDRIRTFTEGVTDKNLLGVIAGAFEEAELIIFLGFSFIDINMEILSADNCRALRILATAKGRSEDTKTRLKHQLARKYALNNDNSRVELFDGKCFELFYEFDHYLTGAQPG